MPRFQVKPLTLLLPAGLVVLALAAGNPIYAQAISGDLSGAVTDPSGAFVPAARVTATSAETGLLMTTSTDNRGEYRISNLAAGEWNLTIAARGFAESRVSDIHILLNQTVTVNVALTLKKTGAAVDVVEAGPAIDTTTAQVENSYSEKQAEDLPSASTGLGVLNFSLLGAGVASSGGVGVGSGPSVGGQRPRNNNFTVDGVDNNNKQATGPVVAIPNDSVAEFSMLQNQFLPEFGHSSGGQFNVIVKSGSNDFHGTLYEYVENRHLNAVDQSFANQGVYTLPRYDQSHLGANYGGPLQRNRLFFFGSFEYNPLGQASSSPGQIFAPTADGYATLASIPGVSQTNLAVMKQYATAAAAAGAPMLVIGQASVPTGLIPVVAPNYTNAYFGVLSMDYAISSKDQLRGRYVSNRTSQIDTGAELPAFFTSIAVNSYLASVTEYHSFTPNLNNEFRAGYSRYDNNSPAGTFKFPGLDAFPNLVFNDLNLQLGPDPSFPQMLIDNVYSASDNLTWARGHHTIKGGTEFRKYIAPQQFSQYLRGDYEYTTAAAYLLDAGPDYQAIRSLGHPVYYGDQSASYSYLQDTWRAMPRLTLTMGLRYEYTTVPVGMRAQQLNAISSVPGLISFHAPKASPYGIAPRVGVAWSPDRAGKTVVRAGFGLSYDVIFDNIGLNSAPPQFNTIVMPDSTGPNFLQNGGITQAWTSPALSAADARAATGWYIPDQKLPYAVNWNLGVQHAFGDAYTIDVRYLGTRGVHLLQQVQLNRRSLVTADSNIPTYLSAPSAATLASLPLTVGDLRAPGSLVPAYAQAGFVSTLSAFEPTGWSFYNGLSVQLNRRFNRDLQFQTAYTWSHNIDNSTAEVASTFLTPRRAQDSQDLSAEKASSLLDRRQRFTFASIYEPKLFHGSNMLLRAALNGWEAAPIFTYESPEYYTVLSGLDSNLNGDSASDRTIINTAGAAGTGTGVYGLDRNGNRILPTAPAAQVNNVAAWVATNPGARYIQAGPGAYANGGRNTEATRPIANMDFSLVRRFPIPHRERMRFDLALQAFNLFNHPQFTPGSPNDAQFNSTATASALSFVNASTAAFNDPTRAFNSHVRVLQITGKLQF